LAIVVTGLYLLDLVLEIFCQIFLRAKAATAFCAS